MSRISKFLPSLRYVLELNRTKGLKKEIFAEIKFCQFRKFASNLRNQILVRKKINFYKFAKNMFSDLGNLNSCKENPCCLYYTHFSNLVSGNELTDQSLLDEEYLQSFTNNDSNRGEECL